MPAIAVNSSYPGSPVCVILINDDDHSPYLCFSLLFLSLEFPSLRSISCMYQPSQLHSIPKLQSSTFQYFVTFVHQVTLVTTQQQYLTHHLVFFINKSQWELVAVPPSLCPHIFDGPWRCAVCKCQDLSPRSPHHWQPFMLCDYDFHLPPECEQVDTAPGRHPGIPTQDITISYGTII